MAHSSVSPDKSQGHPEEKGEHGGGRAKRQKHNYGRAWLVIDKNKAPAKPPSAQ